MNWVVLDLNSSNDVSSSQHRDYSEAAADHIYEDVQSLLDERHEFVRRLLTEHCEQLDRVADAPLHQETVEEEALVNMLGERPQEARS
jgi:cell division protease FtsH